MVVNTLIVEIVAQDVSVPVNVDPLTLISTGKEIVDAESPVRKLMDQSLVKQLSADSSNAHQGIGAGRISTIEEVFEFVAAVDGDHFLVLLVIVLLYSYYTDCFGYFNRENYFFGIIFASRNPHPVCILDTVVIKKIVDFFFHLFFRPNPHTIQNGIFDFHLER